MKKFFLGAALLAAAGGAAGAQTFDVDITLAASGQASWNFTGSFDFDASKSCAAASILCAPGSAQFSHVDVADGYSGGTFTAGRSADGRAVVLYDLNGLPTLTSNAFELFFTVNPSLGPQPRYSLSDITFSFNLNGNGTFRCGQTDVVAVSCRSSITAPATPPVTSAPEIDGQTSVTALSFFFSALLVMRGRRPRGPR